MVQKILVPLDGSELAEQILPYVQEMASCTGAQVVLLEVPSEPAYDYLVPDPELVMASYRDQEEHAETYLKVIAKNLREQDIPCMSLVVRGTPADRTILEVAASIHADMIAMSTHGRGALARLVIGSVADSVVRHAHVPVLLIRPSRASLQHAASERATAAAGAPVTP